MILAKRPRRYDSLASLFRLERARLYIRFWARTKSKDPGLSRRAAPTRNGRTVSRTRPAVARPGPSSTKSKKEEKKESVVRVLFSPNRKTRAESHAIDATRHLYTLQYPVWNLSRLQMIHGSSNLALLCAPRECVWSWPEGYRNFNR